MFRQKVLFFQSNPPSKITWFNPSGALTIFGLFNLFYSFIQSWDLYTLVVLNYLYFLGAQVGALFSNFGYTSS